MHFDFPEIMCMYQSLSLSLSIYICKNGLDPDQTRMEFKKECFVNLKICHAIESMQSVVQKPMRTINGFSVYLNKCIHCPVPCANPEGGRGSGPLSNTRSNPLKFSEQPSQHSTLGHHRHASETPLKGVSLAGR